MKTETRKLTASRFIWSMLLRLGVPIGIGTLVYMSAAGNGIGYPMGEVGIIQSTALLAVTWFGHWLYTFWRNSDSRSAVHWTMKRGMTCVWMMLTALCIISPCLALASLLSWEQEDMGQGTYVSWSGYIFRLLGVGRSPLIGVAIIGFIALWYAYGAYGYVTGKPNRPSLKAGLLAITIRVPLALSCVMVFACLAVSLMESYYPQAAHEVGLPQLLTGQWSSDLHSLIGQFMRSGLPWVIIAFVCWRQLPLFIDMGKEPPSRRWGLRSGRMIGLLAIAICAYAGLIILTDSAAGTWVSTLAGLLRSLGLWIPVAAVMLIMSIGALRVLEPGHGRGWGMLGVLCSLCVGCIPIALHMTQTSEQGSQGINLSMVITHWWNPIRWMLFAANEPRWAGPAPSGMNVWTIIVLSVLSIVEYIAMAVVSLAVVLCILMLILGNDVGAGGAGGGGIGNGALHGFDTDSRHTREITDSWGVVQYRIDNDMVTDRWGAPVGRLVDGFTGDKLRTDHGDYDIRPALFGGVNISHNGNEVGHIDDDGKLRRS